jgi:pyruvate/2-oxoacid:ferredoxin oxidoreductase alpha subunit
MLSKVSPSKLRIDPETKRANFAFIQAEDELAAIGMVLGASWNGARSFTATSGPGVSLMDEILGLGVLRRNSGGGVRRTARRPLDRHADTYAAVRSARRRLRFAR